MTPGAKRYLRYLEAGNRSSSTIYDYGNTFTRFFAKHNDLSTDSVEEFLHTYAPSTRMKYRIQLSGLAKFLKLETVDWSLIPTPKVSTEPPVIMRPEHQATIYKWLLARDRKKGTVYGVAFRLIMHTGLRISELTTLGPDSVDTDRYGMPFLRVLKAAGRSHSKDGRIIPLDRAARRIVTKYGLPLKISARTFSRLLETATRANQIRASYSPHSLRKTCLSRWHEQGVDLKTIADLAGHTSTDTLIHYLDKSPEALRKKMNVAIYNRGGR